MSTSPTGGQDWRRGRPVDTAPPSRPPRYDHPPGKAGRSWRLGDVVDGAFFVVGALLAVWLGWELAPTDVDGWRGLLSWDGAAWFVLFWVLLAYVGLPRLQQVLSKVYVPDYFIGRTLTTVGVLGDPVNLALDGTEADVHAAMAGAGWTRADEVTLRSSWGIVVSALLRRSYPAAPVSPLLLFGRPQAFAYEREVDGNAAQRHHVRFWPVPDGWVLPGGFRVDWLAAATYDRAVGLSLFTLQVTHKVDADVDVERDFVVESVRYAVPSARLRVVEDFSTAFTARNGGGDVVRSDGTLAVLDLTGLRAPSRPAAAPAVSTWEHHLPPPSLLLSGVFLVAKAVLAVAGAVAVTAADVLTSSASVAEVVRLSGATVLGALLWGLVVARRALARVLLMAVCTAEAVLQLALLAGEPRPSLVVLGSAGLSVLVVVSVSSSEVRRWVARRPTDA